MGKGDFGVFERILGLGFEERNERQLTDLRFLEKWVICANSSCSEGYLVGVSGEN